MRTSIFALILSITLGCSLGPGMAGETPRSSREPAEAQSKRIIPQAADSILMSEADYEPAEDTDVQSSNTAAIHLPSDYLVIDVKDYNIDMDEMDEQIVVYKVQDDESDRIHVSVLDFDFIRNSYAVSWESVTSSTNSRSVKTSAVDLTGNGMSEIILFGIDNHGRQTLDIFTPISQITGQGLQFQSIARIVVDGTIELVAPSRADEYVTGYTDADADAEPYTIAVQRQDEASSNIMDLVYEEYHWDAREQEFIRRERRRIPSVEVEESQLQQLYNSDSEAFEDFLRGPWYRARGGDPSDPDAVLVSFFPEEREIVFFNNEMQQIFSWDVSSRTIYRNIRIDMRNQILPSISIFGSVAVVGLETIRIQIQGYNDWDGDYRRLTSSLQQAILQDNNTADIVNDGDFAGLFRNESGTELLFEENHFTFEYEDVRYTGGYGLFQFNGVLILELQSVSGFGLPRENFTFSATMDSEYSDDRIIRRLTLSPVRLQGKNMVPVGGDDIHLEQIIEQSDE
ncbi:MAG: pallilysin-related adhesin [Spirochaeta sp.]